MFYRRQFQGLGARYLVWLKICRHCACLKALLAREARATEVELRVSDVFQAGTGKGSGRDNNSNQVSLHPHLRQRVTRYPATSSPLEQAIHHCYEHRSVHLFDASPTLQRVFKGRLLWPSSSLFRTQPTRLLPSTPLPTTCTTTTSIIPRIWLARLTLFPFKRRRISRTNWTLSKRRLTFRNQFRTPRSAAARR